MTTAFLGSFYHPTDKPHRFFKPKQTPNAPNQPIAGGQDHLQTETNFTGTTNLKKRKGSNSAALGLLGVARLTQMVLCLTTFTQRRSTWLTGSLQFLRLTAYPYLCYKTANACQTALRSRPTYINRPARHPNRRCLARHCAGVAGKVCLILHHLRQQTNRQLD